MTAAGRMHPDDIAAIARAVAAELRGAPAARTGLVDAEAVAQALSVTRQTVYAHADLLGGRRLGSGPRPRLRFDLDDAIARWTARTNSEGSIDDNEARKPLRLLASEPDVLTPAPGRSGSALDRVPVRSVEPVRSERSGAAPRQRPAPGDEG